MKRKIVTLVAGVTAASMLLAGCASNDASNEYVTVAGYKGVEVEDVEEPKEVTDDDIQQYIEAVLAQVVEYEQIKDREVASGDTVDINFVGKVDGKEFEGGSAENYPLTIGSGSFIEGFEDSVIGHKAGDTYDWNGKFPDDYGSEDLAGKDCTFTITVNYIQGEQKEAPKELTDDIVKKVSEKSKTVDEYKKEVKKQLEESSSSEFDSTMQDNAWNAVIEKAEVKKYPDGEVEDNVKQQQEYYQSMAEQYGMELADFLKEYYNVDEETFKKEIQSTSEAVVKERLVAEAIAKKEKLTPKSDKEWDEQYEELAKDYGYADAEAIKEAAEEDVLHSIVIQKLVKQFLAENAIQVKK